LTERVAKERDDKPDNVKDASKDTAKKILAATQRAPDRPKSRFLSGGIMQLDILGSAESFTLTMSRLPGVKFSVLSGTSHERQVHLLRNPNSSPRTGGRGGPNDDE